MMILTILVLLISCLNASFAVDPVEADVESSVNDVGNIDSSYIIYNNETSGLSSGTNNDNGTVIIPEITIDKSINNTVPNYGDVVKYTVRVENIGDSDAINVYVGDSLPEGLDVDSSSISHGGVLLNGVITWVLNITSGSYVDLTYNATVKSYGNLTNLAISGTHNDTNTIDVPEITVDKTSNVTSSYVWDVVSYNILVKNIGDVKAIQVHVNDVVPEGLYVIQSTIKNGTYSKLTRKITWIVDIPVNETIILSYHAYVSEKVLGNLTNIVTVGNHTANNTIEVKPVADLFINITAPEKVNESETFEIVITVHNNGPNEADNVYALLNYSGVNILDLYHNCTDGTSYRMNKWTIGKLANNSTVTLVLHVKALNSGTLTITGNVNSITMDKNLSNNVANVTVIVESNKEPVTPEKGIHMQPTGNPLLALLFILLVTPFIGRYIRFKK